MEWGALARRPCRALCAHKIVLLAVLASAAAAEDMVEIHPQFGSGCLICSDPNPSPSCRRCEGDLSATIPLHDNPWSYDL